MLRILLALILALALTGCWDNISSCTGGCMSVGNGGPVIQGSGNTKTQTLTVGPFTAIRLAVPGNAIIEGGASAQSVAVTADEKLLPLLVTEVRNGTLILGFARDKSYQGKIPEYRIAVGNLQGLDLSGSGTIKASKLTGDALSVTLSGSGDVVLAGQVDGIDLSLEGSGTIDAGDLKAKHAKAVISGSGDATVNASDELDVTISGSGTLRYIGSPKITKKISGSGEVTQK